MTATDIEQSRRLVELGLPRETADMGWYHTSDPYMANTYMYLYTKCSDTCLPAWSLKALWEVMPGVIYGPEPKDHQVELIHTKECICYFDNTGLQHGPSFPTKDGDITAAYNMVCWLLENGYIGERKKNTLETLRNFLNTATKDELNKVFNEVSERCNIEKTSGPAELGEEDESILKEIIAFFKDGTVKLQHDLDLYAGFLEKKLKSIRTQRKQKSEPLEIKFAGKTYKVYGTRILPGDIVGYIIEDEPGHFDCVINPDEVIGVC